jgi:hypothetical protein
MEMNTEYSCVQLNDLPDELLLIIFKKLNNVALLYSLIGVDTRLNKIVYDSTFTKHLAFMTFDSNGCFYSLADLILDQFCSYILPKIRQKIEWLELESSSMERILLATNYPNLYRLGIYKIPAERAVHLFSGKIFDFESSTDKYTKAICQLKSFELTSNLIYWIITHFNIFHIICPLFLFINMNEDKTVMNETVSNRA